MIKNVALVHKQTKDKPVKKPTLISTHNTPHKQHVQPLVYLGLIFTGFIMNCFW
jgi:hypothetical protein